MQAKDLWRTYNHVDFQHSETFSECRGVTRYESKSTLTVVSQTVWAHLPVWIDGAGATVVGTFATTGVAALAAYLLTR